MKQIAGVKSTDKVKNIVLKFEKILKMFFCDWTFYRYCPQGIDIGNWITANNNDLLTLILCAKIKKCRWIFAKTRIFDFDLDDQGLILVDFWKMKYLLDMTHSPWPIAYESLQLLRYDYVMIFILRNHYVIGQNTRMSHLRSLIYFKFDFITHMSHSDYNIMIT